MRPSRLIRDITRCQRPSYHQARSVPILFPSGARAFKGTGSGTSNSEPYKKDPPTE